MNKIETMYRAYLEAAEFTDNGPDDNQGENAELSPLFKSQAYFACRNFLEAVKDCDADNYDQMGHDLWLTRNGHGAGFWDRPKIYGEANATLFTRLSTAMGEHDAEFIGGEE